jgi:diguanylate cyclase (GGDEF)-like protein
MEQSLLQKKTLTLAYMDLDNLKYVNDTYGHREGDQYIQTFTNLISENFRCDDVFARIGGDEFCLVLEGHLQKLTECKLEQIRETLIRENAKNYPVNFSYGVMVVTTNRKNITLNDILEIADRRMYNQKRLHKRIS